MLLFNLSLHKKYKNIYTEHTFWKQATTLKYTVKYYAIGNINYGKLQSTVKSARKWLRSKLDAGGFESDFSVGLCCFLLYFLNFLYHHQNVQTWINCGLLSHHQHQLSRCWASPRPLTAHRSLTSMESQPPQLGLVLGLLSTFHSPDLEGGSQ